MGATHALNISRDSLEQHMQNMGITEGFGVGLEMSGNAAALNQMLSNMSHGGRIAVLGIPLKPIEIDMNQIIFKGIIIKGIYGREMFETWYKMASMLQSGLTIDPVVTHHFAVADYQEAFNAMASGKAGKIILAWE
jgi:threonine 3-dehydrogenase